jgi:hypothetical protein
LLSWISLDANPEVVERGRCLSTALPSGDAGDDPHLYLSEFDSRSIA